MLRRRKGRRSKAWQKRLVKANEQNAQRGGAAGKCLKKGIDFSRGHWYDNSVHTTDGSGITTWSMNRCFADRLGIVYAWKGGFFMQKIRIFRIQKHISD